MFIKNRIESEELLVLKALNTRMELEEKDKQYYLNLQKGYEGEVMFDGYLNGIGIESLIINDLLLELNRSHFQIDSLMITQNLIYLFEVKNYEGEFYFEDGKFKKMNGNEIKNPLLQIERNESLLRQFFTSIGIKIPIESYIVFINPEFTLYQAPIDQHIILPTNLNRFIQQMNSKKSTLNNQHARLSEKLLSSHLIKSPFTQIPKFDYSDLLIGVFCHSCGSVMEEHNVREFICKNCLVKEDTQSTIIRSVKEYRIIFPQEKLSTKIVYEWCGGAFSKKTIRKVLKRSFKVCGYGQWSYYE